MSNGNTPFLHWVTRTQPIRIVFIHLVLPACGWSLATDAPSWSWNIVGWVAVAIPAIGYWLGNYWYWRVRLNKGKRA